MTGWAFDPESVTRELEAMRLKLAKSLESLAKLGPIEHRPAPRTEIKREGLMTLFRYHPVVRKPQGPPLLLVFALVNRPTVLDLEPGRSLIRGLLEAGRDVYLIEWQPPGRGDRDLGLSAYVERFLHAAVEHLTPARGGIDLLGVCQGGTLALLYAALHPKRIRRLVTMVTAGDFQTEDNLLSRWVRPMEIAKLVATTGNVPGEWLTALFLSLMPFRLTLQKYLSLIDDAEKPEKLATFLRMERWIFDSPDQAGRAFGEYVTWFYQQNRFVTGGLVLDGQVVDLKRVTMPVFNIYASRDHLVPPSASRSLAALLGSRRYQELEVETGHIGLYVSTAGGGVAPAIATWLAAR